MPFVFFLIYILVEIALFVWIGGIIGVWWTLLAVLMGFVIGALMIAHGRTESRRWLETIGHHDRHQKPITRQIYWFIGGVLVAIPGFMSDFFGFLLILPPTQVLIRKTLSLFIPEWAQRIITTGQDFRQLLHDTKRH